MALSQQPDVHSVVFPRPRQLSCVEGESQLSADVRLVTSDVLPFIRKTIRSALSSVGVRVVANKKQFVVSLKVVPAESLHLQDVPVDNREHYYELSIIDNLVEVRTYSQMGAVWGAQTFAAIYRAFGHEGMISNLRIRDWSDKQERGMLIETGWGAAEMAPDQWMALMDRILRNKMNLVGVNLCGAADHPVDGGPVDMLLVPVPGREDLLPETGLRWYSAKSRKWQQESKLPRIITDDLFLNIATMAREKGLRMVPGIDLVVLARILARSLKSQPPLPLSSSELRELLETLCVRLANEYLASQAGALRISFATMEDEAESSAFYGETPYEAEEFLVWLIEKIVLVHFDSLILHADFIFGKNARVSPKFVERLQKLGISDKLWLQWGSADLCAEAQVAEWPPSHGTFGGHWLCPVMDRNDWEGYRPRQSQLETTCREHGHKPEFCGIVATGMFDPAYLNHVQLLAQLSWDCQNPGALEDILARGSLVYGEKADDYRAAVEQLARAVALEAVADCCLITQRLDSSPEPAYPLSAVASMLRRGHDQSGRQLQQGIELAQSAAAKLRPIAEESRENLDDFLIKSAGSLLAETARVEGLCQCFAAVMESRNPEQPDRLENNVRKNARQPLLAAMRTIEAFKPQPLVPAALASFSPLLNYLDATSRKKVP